MRVKDPYHKKTFNIASKDIKNINCKFITCNMPHCNNQAITKEDGKFFCHLHQTKELI